MKNLGVEYPLQSEEVKAKIRQTYQKTYGVDHPLQSEEIRDKIRNTCLLLYGVENPFQLKEFKEKYRKTCLIKYGVEHPFQSEEIRDKIRDNCLLLYGVENPSQLKEFKEKYRKTSLIKYGVEHPFQSEEVKAKIRDTCLLIYGVEHPMQHPDIFEKAQKSAHKLKKLTLPSGKEVYFQGYEDWVIQYLLKIGFTEDDIYIERKNIPSFFYENQSGNLHKYYPDIYLKTQNTIIEVKSEYTFQVDEEKINSCRKVVEASGFKYEVWIVDKENECHWIM